MLPSYFVLALERGSEAQTKNKKKEKSRNNNTKANPNISKQKQLTALGFRMVLRGAFKNFPE
jgi:hypothetical protein